MAWYDVFYNTQIAPLEKKYTGSYEDYLAKLKEQPASLHDTMQKMGLMGAGGKVDYSSLLDTGALTAAKNRGRESEALDLAAIQKSAAQSSALSGTGGGTSATNSLAELANTSGRNYARDYADTYRTAADTAKQEAYQQGQQEQSDLLAKQQAEQNAAAAQTEYYQTLLNSQTPGLLQTPEGIQAIANIAGAAVGAPGIGSLLGGLFTPKESNLKNYGITKEEYNWKPSEHSGYSYRDWQDLSKNQQLSGMTQEEWNAYQDLLNSGALSSGGFRQTTSGTYR